MNPDSSRSARPCPARAGGRKAPWRGGLRAVCLLLALALLAPVCGAGAVFAEQQPPPAGPDTALNAGGPAEPTPAPEPPAETAPEPPAEPTPGPATEPTSAPPADPTPEPTAGTTPAPAPTAGPTAEPTPAPTAEPTPTPEAGESPDGQPDGDEVPGLCPHHTAHTPECGGQADAAACGFACDACVTGWQWQDEEGLLVWDEQAGLWGLGLPGAGAGAPLTREDLLALLPQQILAQTAAGERKAALVWALDTLPDPLPEGEYILAAALPDGFALTETAPALEVCLAVGGGETMAEPKAKYLNQWSFVSRLDEKADIAGDEVIWIPVTDPTDTQLIRKQLYYLLPNEVRGWIYGGSETAGIKTDAFNGGFTFNSSDDKLGETKGAFAWDGSVWQSYSAASSSWGRVSIEWSHPTDAELLQAARSGSPIQLSAQLKPPRTDGYCIVVNSNDDPLEIYCNHSEFLLSGGKSNNPNLLRLQIAFYNPHLENHIVPAANPNVRVNLFDYWVATEKPTIASNGDILPKSEKHIREKEPDDPAILTGYAVDFSGQEDWYQGINKGHLLLFGDGLIHAGLWNKGAGAATQYGKKYAGMEKIVKPVLANGYPELNLDLARDILATAEQKRDYRLIRDSLLAGEHIGWDGSQTYPSETDPGLNVQNLSETLIRLWETDTHQTLAAGTESLQYLFDPDLDTPCRRVFRDVKGLFQLDDKGYFYYSMRENFAEFSQEGGQNHFILYDAPATLRTDGADKKSIGNFFPFNRGDEVFDALVDPSTGKPIDASDPDAIAAGRLFSSVDSARNSMNHHLGMTVEVNFLQPREGMVDAGGSRQPMTFEFSGDDDVWVFIDDVLVLDLGGNHSELYGTINFATGNVYIGRAFNTKGIPALPSDGSKPQDCVTSTTLLQLFKDAHREDSAQWSNNTFASGTSHTLKMFYLERGNYDSSLALRFNLQPLVYEQIRKVDQNGRPLAGVGFELYPAGLASADEDGAIECLYTDAGSGNGPPFYVKQTGTSPLVRMVTDADGYARFLTGQDGSYFNFADGGSSYYILKETNAPSGYRSPPVDVVLHYDPTAAVLSVANRWTTGAYACSMIHVRGTGALYYGSTPTAGAGGVLTPPADSTKIDDEVLADGLPVAVPVLRKKTGSSWLALYGSNLGGFHSVDVGGRWETAVLTAVLNQAKGDGDGWYGSWEADNRRLTGVLNDMPGLASRYLTGDDISIVYAILTPDALKTLGIEGGTADTRYEALRRYVRGHGVDETLAALQRVTGGFRFLPSASFNRNFRSLIYLPNERRELRVWKVDQDGNGVNGASFGLYSDPACTRQVSFGVTGTVDGRNGVLVFKPGGAGPGEANMMWASRGFNETLYLRETAAPAGHLRNTTVIPVRVGNYSIYADAGRLGDGVQVLAGAGTLTQTMRQYALDNDVDITLRDITAYMQTQPSSSFAMDGWRDAVLSGTGSPGVLRGMNLHYGLNTSAADGSYGLHKEDGGERFKPFFSTDTGFIRVRVGQNYSALTGNRYEGSNNDANKDNLGTADLTNLFSLLNVVVVTDPTVQSTNTGMLTIGKWVNSTTPADYTALFSFKVELFDPDYHPLAGGFDYQFYGQDKVGRVQNGDTLLLHHDERLTILGLPAGTRYKITETAPAGSTWNTLPANMVIEGVIGRDETSAAAFINSRSPLTRTGDLTIQKTVEAGGEEDRAFTFTVTLRNGTGAALPGPFTYNGSHTGTLASGDTIQLKHGESITIRDLPIGTLYTVTEQAVPGYRSGVIGGSWVVGGVAAGDTTTAEFINILYEEPTDPAGPTGRGGREDSPPPPALYSAVPATGDDLERWVLLAAVSAIGLLVVGLLRRRQPPPLRRGARRAPRKPPNA